MKADFLESVKSYIEEYDMLRPEDRVVIGVSGGADSVALLRVILMLKDPSDVRVVHVNHGIRGEEAKRDQQFVEELCRSLGVECKVYTANIPEMAERLHLTEEEAGRRFRYDCFNREADNLGEELTDRIYSDVKLSGEKQLDKKLSDEKKSDMKNISGRQETVGRTETAGRTVIAVAHNRDDLAETVIYNMIRGSSLLGLAGIRPVRDRIIRPLLMESRARIEEFLRELGQDYVTDSTNLQTDYTRNKLRHIVIPELVRINEGAVQHIVDIARDAEELRIYTEQQVRGITSFENDEFSRTNDAIWKMYQIDKDYSGNDLTEDSKTDERICPGHKPLVDSVSIDISLINSNSNRNNLEKGEIVLSFLEMVCGRRKDITRNHIRSVIELADMETGKRISLPYGMVAEKVYNKIKVYTEARSTREGQAESLQSAFSINIFSREEINEISRDEYTKMIDCDKICGTLSFRHPEDGDYIVTRSDGGRKKLSRFFTDNKVERDRRPDMIVVADGNEIVWGVGLRLSERYKITDATKRIMSITYKADRL